MAKITLLYIFIFLYAANCFSQEARTDTFKNSLSIRSAYDMSHGGFSTALALEYDHGNHGFYLGPSFSVFRNYFPANASRRAIAGYNFFFRDQNKKCNFFINLDYRLGAERAYSAQGDISRRWNHLHQFNFGYGIQLMVHKHVIIGNSIGIGRFIESYYSYRTSTRSTYQGFDSMIRFFLKIRLITN